MVKRCCKSPLIESANTNIESEMSFSRCKGTFTAGCFHEYLSEGMALFE